MIRLKRIAAGLYQVPVPDGEYVTLVQEDGARFWELHTSEGCAWQTFEKLVDVRHFLTWVYKQRKQNNEQSTKLSH